MEIFKPLHEQRLQLERVANRKVSYSSNALLFFMGFQMGIVSRLTWWDLSWDIMEPYSYMLTLMNSVVCYLYYLVTRQDFEYPKVYSLRYKKNLNTILKQTDFNADKYNKVLGDLQELTLKVNDSKND